MSKPLLRSLFRPYICKHCRTQISSSPTGLRRNITNLPKGKQAINNAEQVERRIEALGGKDELQKLYTHIRRKPQEEILSPNEFRTVYKKIWDQMTDQKKADQRIVSYGRVTSTRRHGRKLAFIEFEIGGESTSKGHSAQAMLSLDYLKSLAEDTPDDALKHLVTKIQRGDWITVRGRPELTTSGEFVIRASELPTMLAPSLQTVPLELHDQEFRMRNRHADQIINPSERDIIFLRDELMKCFQAYMQRNNFIQVNTPLIVPDAGGAAARPFETTATEFTKQTLNLRVAPELFLKRMIIGGMQRVFELGPAFRNEGVDATHNPEFTIAEFYGIMLRLEDLMAMTEALFEDFANVTREASHRLDSVSKPSIDFSVRPYPVIRFIPAIGRAIREHIPDWRFPDLENADASTHLQRTYRQLDMQLPAEPTIPRLLDGLSARFLEPQCEKPTFIINQPECMAPLAKSFLKHSPTEGDNVYHKVSARAELFIQGREYVNCYEEENSPFEQRRKFEEQMSLHQDEESPRSIDESYLSALEWGMPPTGGWGCGMDRIIMLFGGKSRIADVLPFGTLRNVVGLGTQMRYERQLQQQPVNKARKATRNSREKYAMPSLAAEEDAAVSTAAEEEARTSKRQPSHVDGAGHALRRTSRRDKKELIDEENLDWLGDTVPKEDLERDVVEEEDDGDDSPSHQRIPAQRQTTNLSGTASFRSMR